MSSITLKRIKIILTIALPSILSFFFFIRMTIWSIPHWNETLTTHTLIQKDASHLELLWIQNVFTPNGNDRRQLAATNSKVFFIGTLSQRSTSGLVALDNQNGSELWHIFHARTVEVGSDMVYVDDQSYVVAYTLAGKKVWRTGLLTGGKSVSYIHLVDGRLYTESATLHHILDASSGKRLEISSDLEQFQTDFSDWYFSNMSTFVGKYVFVRENSQFFSKAFAFNRENQNVEWQTADNVISNVVATEKLAFVITYENELRILDAKTGKLVEKIQIEPSINYFSEEIDSESRVYQLAIDQTTQTLYVLLGDSNQLFAFRIHE